MIESPAAKSDEKVNAALEYLRVSRISMAIKPVSPLSKYSAVVFLIFYFQPLQLFGQFHSLICFCAVCASLLATIWQLETSRNVLIDLLAEYRQL